MYVTERQEPEAAILEKLISSDKHGMKILLLFLLFSTSTAYADCQIGWDISPDLQNYYQDVIDDCDNDLKQSLFNRVKGHKALSYTKARKAMFEDLDNMDGQICSVYSSKCVDSWGVPDHTVMNCEHSWPQSLGATGTAKSDLHHLFPVMSRMNSRRGNFPFCEVDEITYEEDGSALGHSSAGTRCFEPKDEHKGDVARAMFYFSIRYNKRIDGEQESFFRKWHHQDSVSEKEVLRNDAIYGIQDNRNPFVDNTELVDYIGNF